VIVAIELKVTGLEINPIIADYELAAHARSSISLEDILSQISSNLLIGSLALLLLFTLLSRIRELQLHFSQIALIIVSYTACQLALNLTNFGGSGSSMWLAPAAMASLAICLSTQSVAQDQLGSKIRCHKFSRSRLAETSLREALAFVIFGLVLVPEVIASISGLAIGTLVSLGLVGPSIVVSTGNEIKIESLVDWPSKNWPDYLRSLSDGVTAIAALHLDKQAIANLDFANPFPVLFLAPPPKGIQVWWDFGFNVPEDAVPEMQTIIGDACVVTVPLLQPSRLDASARLVKIAQSTLETEFKMIYND
jgi:hypothetical protein